MQKFALKLAGLGLVMAVFFFSSCGDDPVVVNPLGPDIQFVGDPGFLNADSDVIINEGFSVKVRLSKGDALLQTLEISEGSSKLATNRFTINSGVITSNNPLLITGADKDGVTYTIDITPSGTEAVGDITTYTFTTADESGETDAVDIVITTADTPGTDLSMSITGVLLNQAGVAGTGALDLDEGLGTGVSSDGETTRDQAEIRDLGIDCTVSSPNENWRAQFGTVNGAVMRRVDLSMLENFTFENVDKKEIIQDAYDSGMGLSNGISTAPNCDETTVTNTSGEVVVGDMFVVFANSTYYLIKVDEINPINMDDVSTPGVNEKNTDNYVFSIKY